MLTAPPPRPPLSPPGTRPPPPAVVQLPHGVAGERLQPLRQVPQRADGVLLEPGRFQHPAGPLQPPQRRAPRGAVADPRPARPRQSLTLPPVEGRKPAKRYVERGGEDARP